MNNTVSIIVPVYNVKPYLTECIDSICNQLYSDLEIILIDDGSTDGSGEICDFYAEKDDRIRVIHQKNSGAAAARNAGLRIATGEYLAFADGDDIVEKDAYSYMVSALIQEQADAIQGSFRNVFQNESRDRVMLENYCVMTVTDFMKRYAADWTAGLLWDKLFRRVLFKDILFEEGHIIDDEFFTYQGMMNANKIVHSPKIVYNYRIRQSSVMKSPASKQRIITDKLEYLSVRREKIIKRFPELQKLFDEQYISLLLLLLKENGLLIDTVRRIQSEIKRFLLDTKRSRLRPGLLMQAAAAAWTNSNSYVIRQNTEYPPEKESKRYFE